MIDYSRDVGQIDVGEELCELIAARIESHERSLQVEIGASELGTPCIRRLGLKLAEVPAVTVQRLGSSAWRPTVGVAVHDWLADMLRAHNAVLAAEAKACPDNEQCHPWCGEPDDHAVDHPVAIENRRGQHVDRWLVEQHTAVGTIYEREVPGTMDVFDRWTHTLVDWKIVGPTAIKNYRKEKDPGPGYKTQAHLYGRGLSRKLGERVDYVGIMFLPSNGELKDHFYWEEEFDPKVGAEALRRARELLRLIQDEGETIFRKLKTVNDHCAQCPFFAPGSNSPIECPGDPSLTANMDEGFADILGKSAARG